MKEKKKELTMGPNNARCIIWAILILTAFPALQNVKKYLHMLVSKINMKEKKRKNLLWAQMMPDALFGLFSFSSPSLTYKTLTTSIFIS